MYGSDGSCLNGDGVAGNALSEDGIVKIKEKEEMMMRWWREMFDAYLVAQ